MKRRVSRVVMVGKGRMASAFVAAFREAGVAFATHGTHAVAPKRPSTLWILAITDVAIPGVVRDLARTALRRGDAVVHLAGMLGVEVLAPARAVGATIGALHPLVAVASTLFPPPLRGAIASFEGDAGCRRLVNGVAAEIGLRVVTLRPVDRVRYHAAAALVATGAIALAHGATKVWTGLGIPERTVRAFVSSLLVSAAHNVVARGASRALASPLLRGDVGTIEKHLRTLRAAPRARDLYAAALAQVLESLARDGALPPAVARRARSAIRAVSPRAREH